MRIAIMSLAHHHGEAYVPNLRAIPDAELIGFADDIPQRAQKMAEQFNLRQFAGYAALLQESPDGVVICSENNRHRELVEMALSAGVKNVLCEKPLATTLEDAQAIVHAADAAGARLMTAFPVRFSPALRETKALIDAGKLGKIIGCNATNQGENPGHLRDWFVDKRLSGGGAVMDHTVHVVDMLRWMFQSEIVEIYAEVGHLFPATDQSLDTAGILMIQFANGAFVGLDCSWSRPNYYPTWGNVKIEFVGEQGLATVDVFAQHTTRYSDSIRRPLWDSWGSDINQAMIDEFVASIRENRQPFITGYDGLKAVEAVIAAYLSAQSHQPVRLPLT
jgi:predicted dehydrogenase